MQRLIYRFSLLALLLTSASTAQVNSRVLADRDVRYRLQPNDSIEIRYRYTPEFDQTATLQPDGFVSLLLVGDLKLAGLTLEQSKSLLLEKSSVRLRNPEIALVLKEFAKPHFVVAGEVANPGRFDLHGDVMALEAVAMAGGLKTSAKHSQAILYRKRDAESAEARLIDLKHIATQSHIAEDIYLRPGDLLFVPQNRISKIERIVKLANIGVYMSPLRF